MLILTASKITLAFAHDDVVRGGDGAVEREQRFIAELKKGTDSKEYKDLTLEIANPHLAAKVSGQDAEQILRNYELHGWVTSNVFELLSHDVELGQEGADNLKTRLTDTYRDRNSDPDAFALTLSEATLRYKDLSLEEVNQRVSKGLGFGDKVQELAENSPESLKEFIQFNYEKVNEELVKRGLPTVELKPGFTDELITKLTSDDATIKAEGQSAIAEMFTYVEQLDISTQIEGHTSYKKFQAEAQAFGTMLSGLDDDALEGYISTFKQTMNEQNPGVTIDYGEDPVGTIADILSSSNTPEKRLQLEGLYATWKQQVGGNEAAKAELNQIVNKQSFSDRMVSIAKQSDRAYYDVAKIIFGIGEGADFTPEQRTAADGLLANIKAGDPATYKNALNDAHELVQSLDDNSRKALDDRYNAFLNDNNSENNYYQT
jgi:hypothetical protein